MHKIHTIKCHIASTRCNFCGRDVDFAFKFCPYCGKAIVNRVKGVHDCRTCYTGEYPCGFRNIDGFCSGYVSEYDAFLQKYADVDKHVRGSDAHDYNLIVEWRRLRDYATGKGWHIPDPDELN